MDKYVLTEALGSGAFGTVYKGYRRQDDLPVAVKVINSTTYSWDEIVGSREVVALTQCLHPNIVPLVEVILSRHAALHMVFEYFPTDLLKLLKRSGNNSSPSNDVSDEESDFGFDGCTYLSNAPLPKAPSAMAKVAYPPTARLSIRRIQHIGVQLLSALSHIHARGFLHRDVKPENVLVRTHHERDHAVLADLGLARRLPTDSAFIAAVTPLSHDSLGNRASDNGDLLTEYVATRWYRAPELLLRCVNYNASIDIWGAACVLAELALGRPLFMGESEEEVLRRIAGTLGTPHDPDVDSTHTADPRTEWRGFHALCAVRGLRMGRWPRAGLQPLLRGGEPALCGLLCALLEDMLAWDPAQRPSAEHCLQHPFFADVDSVEVPIPSPPLLTNQLPAVLSLPANALHTQTTAPANPRVPPLPVPAENAALPTAHSSAGASPPSSVPGLPAQTPPSTRRWQPMHAEHACVRARWVGGARDVYACALEEVLRSHPQQLCYRRADGHEGLWPGLMALTNAVGDGARVGVMAQLPVIPRGGPQESAPSPARSRSRPQSRHALMGATAAPQKSNTHPDTAPSTEPPPLHRRVLPRAGGEAADSDEEARDSDDDECVLRGLRCSWPMAEVARVVRAADTCAQQLVAARTQLLQSHTVHAPAEPAPPMAYNDTHTPQALPRPVTPPRAHVQHVHTPPNPARQPSASPPPLSPSSPEPAQQSARTASASLPATGPTDTEAAAAPVPDSAPPTGAVLHPTPAAPSPSHARTPARARTHVAPIHQRPSSGRLSSAIPLAAAAGAHAASVPGLAPPYLPSSAHLPLSVPRLFARKAQEQGILVVPLFKHALKFASHANAHGVLSVFLVTADASPTDLFPLTEQMAFLRGAPAAIARVARARLDACLPSPRYATLVLARDGVAAACRARLRPGLDAHRCVLKMASFALAQLQTQTQQQGSPCTAELDATDAQAVCAAMDAWGRGMHADGSWYTQPPSVAAALLQGAHVDVHGVVTDAPPTPAAAEDEVTRRRALLEALATETDDLEDLGDLLDAAVDEEGVQDEQSGVASSAAAAASAVAAGIVADMMACPPSEPITAHDDDVLLGHRLQRTLMQHLLSQPAPTPAPAPPSARPQTPPTPALARSLAPDAQPGTPARLTRLLGAQSAALRAHHASTGSAPVSAPPVPPAAPPPAAVSLTPALPPLRRAVSPAARSSTPSLLRHLHTPTVSDTAAATDIVTARRLSPASLPPLRGQPPASPSSRPQTPLTADAVLADDAPWHGTRTFALPPLSQLSRCPAEPSRPSVASSIPSARPVLGRSVAPPRLPVLSPTNSALSAVNPLAYLPVRPAPGPGLGRVVPARVPPHGALVEPRLSSTDPNASLVTTASKVPRAPARTAPLMSTSAPTRAASARPRLTPAFLVGTNSAAEDSAAEDSDEGPSGLSPRDSPRVRTHAYARLLSGGQAQMGTASHRHVHSRPAACADLREAEGGAADDDAGSDATSENGVEFSF